MDDQQRQQLIEQSWGMHSAIESSYLATIGQTGDDNWDEKQRILLADMALHLLQSALTEGELNKENLKNNIHAILSISDQFLPEAKLKLATEKLWQQSA